MPDMQSKMAASRDWERAQRQAFVESVVSALPFAQSSDLLSFEDVKQRLKLAQRNYRGIQEVDLDQIRGSVGRYRDFTASFNPRKPQMRDRWIRVSAAAGSGEVPPVELFKVGDAFFVMDGNHRVSAARQAGAPTIQAHVWEFTAPTGLSAHADLDELLIREEYANFLEQTHLDQLRPEQDITFTVPGKYNELLAQIAWYQDVLTRIDGEPCSYENAVTSWYDMIYTPAVQIIQHSDALEHFPGRTEADLFVWMWLYSRFGEGDNHVTPLREAASVAVEQQEKRRPLARLFSGKKDIIEEL